jgi:hypothetical protein
MARVNTAPHLPPPTEDRETRLRVFTGRREESAPAAEAEPVALPLAETAPRFLAFPDDAEQTDSLYAAARQTTDAWYAPNGEMRWSPATETETPRQDGREIDYGDSLYAAARLAAERPPAPWTPDPGEETGPSSPGRSPGRPPASRTTARDAAPHRTRIMARDLDILRQRRVVRVFNRLFDRYDLQHGLPAAYRQLRDDSHLFQPGLGGFLLQASVNLQRVGGLGYPLAVPRAGLGGLLIAPGADVRPERGVLRLEIHLSSGELAARATCPAAEIEPDVPLQLDFPPLPACLGTCRLGIFADGVDVPIYLLEWRRYRYWGLGRTQSRAFCALVFPGEA